MAQLLAGAIDGVPRFDGKWKQDTHFGYFCVFSLPCAGQRLSPMTMRRMRLRLYLQPLNPKWRFDLRAMEP
jgi:hypothetical protein